MPSQSPINVASNTPLPTTSLQPSNYPSHTPTKSSSPSSIPSHRRSGIPTLNPTIHSSTAPSHQPTPQSTSTPSSTISSEPSHIPSQSPSITKSIEPSMDTTVPSNPPSNVPSIRPTTAPSNFPSQTPSINPTQTPSMHPTSHIDTLGNATFTQTFDARSEMNATEIIQFQSIVKGVITSEDTWMVIDSVVVTSQHYRRDTNVNVDDADLARNLDRRRRMKEEQGTVPWRLHISGYILGRVVSFPMNDLGKRLFVVRLGRLLSNLDDHGNVLQGPLSESMPLFDVEPTEWYNITVADADPTVGKEPSSQGIVQDATSEDNGEASTSDSTFVRAGIGIGVAGFLVLAAVLAKSTERRRTRRWNVNAGRNANDPAADQTEQEGGIYIVEAGEMMDVSSPASLSPKRTSCSNHDTLVHTRTQSYYSQSNDHCHRNGMEENKVSTLSYSDTSSEFLEHDFFMSLTSSSVNTASATLTTKNSAEMQMQMHEDMVTGMDMNMQMDIDADGHRDGGRDGDGMGWSQNFPVQKLVRSHFASLDVSHHQHQQHDSQLENDMDALAYLEEDASLSTECHDGNDVASNVNSLMNDTPNKNVDHQGGMRRMFACFGDGRTSTHGNGTIPRSGSKVPQRSLSQSISGMISDHTPKVFF